MSFLSDEQREELDALAHINKVLGRKSFIMRSHWHTGYASLVRRGLVRWTSPPKGFDRRRFAGIHITARGRAALVATPPSKAHGE
jgi:hypothetical protein